MLGLKSWIHRTTLLLHYVFVPIRALVKLIDRHDVNVFDNDSSRKDERKSFQTKQALAQLDLSAGGTTQQQQ